MTYWGEIKDSHIQFWNTEKYPSYYKIKNQISEQGYRCDLLQPSEILYLGTCDMMNLFNGESRWSYMHHTQFYPNHPFIALGAVASGLPSMVRRLYSYIQHYGAPKRMFMTIPRFDGREFVNKSGKCYNVSSRLGSANFSYESNLITEEERDIWAAQLSVNKQLNNSENIKYLLEERFAFIETMCKAYNIELRWTFNVSDAGIVVLYNNLSLFENISNFMKDSFVGMPQIKGLLYDRSIDHNTHLEVYSKFANNEKWNYERFCQQAIENFNWLKEKYGDDLIKGDDKREAI